MTCISGPPWRPGKTAELIFLPRCFVVGQDHAAARAAQGLVGGRRDDVGVGDRVRVDAAGYQAGEVGHVDHQVGADFVGDLAEARRSR